jgi:hypothetical protein
MSTKRRPLYRAYLPPISAEALSAFRRGRMAKRGSPEFREAAAELQRAIGLSKFEASPLAPERGSLLGGDLESPRLARRWRDALEAADRTQP